MHVVKLFLAHVHLLKFLPVGDGKDLLDPFVLPEVLPTLDNEAARLSVVAYHPHGHRLPQR